MIGPRRALGYAIAVVALLSLGAALHHLQFALGDFVLQGRDCDFHVQNYFKVFHCHFDAGRIMRWYQTVGYDSVRWPPLSYLLAAAIREGTGVGGLLSIQLANLVWLLVLVFCLFGGGRRFGDSPWSGLAAVMLGAINPLVLGVESRDINLDFAATAAVAAAFYAFSRTDWFARPRATIALGLICALSLLTKTVVAIYLAPFYLVALLWVVLAEREQARRRLRNAAFALVLCVLSVSVFFVPLLRNVYREFRGEAIPSLASLGGNLVRYAGVVFGFPLVIYTVLGAVALAYCLKHRDRLAAVWGLSGLIALAWFVGMRFVTMYYLFPLQIYAVLLVARALGFTTPRRRAVIAMLLLILAVATVLAPERDPEQKQMVVDGQGGRRTFDLLVHRFAYRYRMIEEKDIGYLVDDNMATESVRRLLVGGVLAAARPHEAWLRAFRKKGDDIALFCSAEVPPGQLDVILAKPLVVAIAHVPPVATEPCVQELDAALKHLLATHRLDGKIRIDFPQPGPYGFGESYHLMFLRRTAPVRPAD